MPTGTFPAPVTGGLVPATWAYLPGLPLPCLEQSPRQTYVASRPHQKGKDREASPVQCIESIKESWEADCCPQWGTEPPDGSTGGRAGQGPLALMV